MITKKELKIAVVIVTYNNASMLGNLLDSLMNQTRIPDEIIIIDNSHHSFREIFLNKNDKLIRYLRMSENVGTAGGYYEGIKAALEGNHDFILTLDDDVKLSGNSVEELIKGFEIMNQQDSMVGAVRAVSAWQDLKEPTKMDFFAWRGTLMKVDAIRKVGLPCRDYFLYADDIEYAIRFSMINYNFYWIPKSKIIERQREGKIEHNVGRRKVIFYADNFRFYYACRNSIHVYKKYGMYSYMLRVITYNIKIIFFLILFYRFKELKKIKAIMIGSWDGFCSHLGKNIRYLPIKE
jgi:rhamnopyranosyl-N-acetylglucosaminyl-diphospho-decaprenol beta-1,3/1,4-galactofuranosyltransferase